MHIAYYRSVREAHSGIIVWTIKIIENTIKTIKTMADKANDLQAIYIVDL